MRITFKMANIIQSTKRYICKGASLGTPTTNTHKPILNIQKEAHEVLTFTKLGGGYKGSYQVLRSSFLRLILLVLRVLR